MTECKIVVVVAKLFDTDRVDASYGERGGLVVAGEVATTYGGVGS